jgi:hypothetical protein
MGGARDGGRGQTGPDSLEEFQDLIWIGPTADNGNTRSEPLIHGTGSQKKEALA